MPVANSRSMRWLRAKRPMSPWLSSANVAELAHVAHDQPAPRIHAREHFDPGLHRARVGVVRVVHDPGATRRGFELQSARNRAHCGKPRAHVVERRAGRGRRRGRAQRVQHVVIARQVQLDRHRRPRAPRSLKRVTKPAPSMAVWMSLAEKSAGVATPKVVTRAARHAAPQRRELVVGIDDRGGGGLEPGDHFAFGARHAFDAAETLEMFGAGVGDEAHGRARELAPAPRLHRRDSRRSPRPRSDARRRADAA